MNVYVILLAFVGPVLSVVIDDNIGDIVSAYILTFGVTLLADIAFPAMSYVSPKLLIFNSPLSPSIIVYVYVSTFPFTELHVTVPLAAIPPNVKLIVGTSLVASITLFAYLSVYIVSSYVAIIVTSCPAL